MKRTVLLFGLFFLVFLACNKNAEVKGLYQKTKEAYDEEDFKRANLHCLEMFKQMDKVTDSTLVINAMEIAHDIEYEDSLIHATIAELKNYVGYMRNHRYYVDLLEMMDVPTIQKELDYYWENEPEKGVALLSELWISSEDLDRLIKNVPDENLRQRLTVLSLKEKQNGARGVLKQIWIASETYNMDNKKYPSTHVFNPKCDGSWNSLEGLIVDPPSGKPYYEYSIYNNGNPDDFRIYAKPDYSRDLMVKQSETFVSNINGVIIEDI